MHDRVVRPRFASDWGWDEFCGPERFRDFGSWERHPRPVARWSGRSRRGAGARVSRCRPWSVNSSFRWEQSDDLKCTKNRHIQFAMKMILVKSGGKELCVVENLRFV